jgi:hypothetical protein
MVTNSWAQQLRYLDTRSLGCKKAERMMQTRLCARDGHAIISAVGAFVVSAPKIFLKLYDRPVAASYYVEVLYA